MFDTLQNGDDITLHARWKVTKNKVNFMFDSETTYLSVEYKYGDAIVKPADPELGEGESFVGWKDESGEWFDFGSAGFMGDKEINLYAVIDKKEYTISYFISDGQGGYNPLYTTSSSSSAIIIATESG